MRVVSYSVGVELYNIFIQFELGEALSNKKTVGGKFSHGRYNHDTMYWVLNTKAFKSNF